MTCGGGGSKSKVTKSSSGSTRLERPGGIARKSITGSRRKTARRRTFRSIRPCCRRCGGNGGVEDCERGKSREDRDDSLWRLGGPRTVSHHAPVRPHRARTRDPSGVRRPGGRRLVSVVAGGGPS